MMLLKNDVVKYTPYLKPQNTDLSLAASIGSTEADCASVNIHSACYTSYAHHIGLRRAY